ncbi:MAG: DNA polymerase III subunit gamma/tau [Planctomycetota bacterium]
MTVHSEENSEQHLVVALKYRPDSFEKLVGQDHIATALANAIKKNRVGHAYLFTGARGVGKTSSARIFAKCLNCQRGPTSNPCNQCDICEAVSSGEDVDVLEIDGASNRGIDEIRQLRSNISVRPSRSRFKIYIIDEVHMLTMQAFNALLKTLEEPPSHVKFIFCTTDPQKIPITVLSRCQRFDFSPVQTDEIANRLREIATSEGVEADEAALALLARRANGSMRDSQSLLEQLLSFCGTKVSVEEVNQLLGTADIGRIAGIAEAMIQKDPATTLTLINQGVLEGVDAGQMAEQLLGYFRDMMAVRVGCGEEILLNCTSADLARLSEYAEQLGLETVLSIVQLLDAALVKMQSSLHARTLLEAAAIRVCNLEDLDTISGLVEALGNTDSKKKPPRVARKKVELKKVSSAQNSKKKENPVVNKPVESQAVPVSTEKRSEKRSSAAVQPKFDDSNGTANSFNVTAAGQVSDESSRPINSMTSHVLNDPSATASPASDASSMDLRPETVETIWKKLIVEIDDMTSDMAASYRKLDLKSSDHLVVTLENKVSRDLCSKPEKKQKFEKLLTRIAGKPTRVDFVASQNAVPAKKPTQKLTRNQQIRKLHENPFLKKVITMFDAEIVGYHEPNRSVSRAH